MFRAFCLSIIVASCLCFPGVPADHSKDTLLHFFRLFKKSYNKVYASEEEESRRFEIFSQAVKRISTSENSASGITKFSDLTEKEFKSLYTPKKFFESEPLLGENLESWGGECTSCVRFPGMDTFEDDHLDWVMKGAVTPVKNQAQCGSCWSFSTTGDIEGSWFLGGHDLVSLSEQQLVSCDHTDSGCGGGLPSNAMQYVIDAGGLVPENSYPYTSGEGYVGSCNSYQVAGTKAATISSWKLVSSHDYEEDQLKEALIKGGPISIALDATPMQDYFGGIDNPSNCGSGRTDLDHAVLLVGFGEEDGQKFWKIKNSWGGDWGEEGYYRLVRGENKCGIAMMAVHSAL